MRYQERLTTIRGILFCVVVLALGVIYFVSKLTR